MATIVMEAAKVIKAADNLIARIEAERKRRDEENIADRMQPRKFMGFKLKTRTREEAIKYLDSIDPWGWQSIYAYGDLGKAKALKLLAEHGDPVTLDQHDITVLF